MLHYVVKYKLLNGIVISICDECTRAEVTWFQVCVQETCTGLDLSWPECMAPVHGKLWRQPEDTRQLLMRQQVCSLSPEPGGGRPARLAHPRLVVRDETPPGSGETGEGSRECPGRHRHTAVRLCGLLWVQVLAVLGGSKWILSRLGFLAEGSNKPTVWAVSGCPDVMREGIEGISERFWLCE